MVEDEPWHGYICRTVDDKVRSMWSINGLWRHAAGLPVETVAISSLKETLEEVVTLTKAEIGEKVRRVMAADLAYPIIFSEEGWLMDGSHRIMKSLALGLSEVKAVRFVKDPLPDKVRYYPFEEDVER